MKKLFFIPQAYFISLMIFYVIAHGGIVLISQAVYWDDWTIINLPPTLIKKLFKEAGSFLNYGGLLHVLMMLGGPWLYKTLVLCLNFFSGLFLWQIASKQDWINESERYYIVLLFLITPCMAARVAAIDFPYTLSLFFFFMAWAVIDKNRLVALLLFFVSFNTPSFLVFYALPILDWYVRDLKKSNYQQKLFRWAILKLDFILLPFVWFLIKNIYFKPYGYYVGYNEAYHLKNLVTSSIGIIKDLFKLNINLPITFLICILCAICGKLPEPLFFNRNKKMIYLGLFALILGLFPYMILGYAPTFEEWTSRHQLLMPLGLSLIFVGFISLAKSIEKQKIYILLLIAISLSLNLKNYFELFFDWQKQQLLMQFIANSDEIKKSSLVLIDDKTKNALNRTYRFYEWNGIMKNALHNEKHFGIDVSEIDIYNSGYFDKYFTAYYAAAEHVRNSRNAVILIIEKNKLKRSLFSKQPMYVFSIKNV
jgi:hypothetical protein